MKDKYKLYRQTTEELYIPAALRRLDVLSQKTYWATLPLIKHQFDILQPDVTMTTGCNRIKIFTNNFYGTSHWDPDDDMPKGLSKKVLDSIDFLIEEGFDDDGFLHNLLSFYEDFDTGLYTTCSYQFPLSREAEEILSSGGSLPEIKVFYIFLMNGLGVTLRIPDIWSHMFYSVGFQHCTCMPIIIVDDKMFFGEHRLVDLAAWGPGGDSDAEKQRRENHRRWCDRQLRRIDVRFARERQQGIRDSNNRLVQTTIRVAESGRREYGGRSRAQEGHLV